MQAPEGNLKLSLRKSLGALGSLRNLVQPWNIGVEFQLDDGKETLVTLRCLTELGFQSNFAAKIIRLVMGF